jgi:hypothetical protein
MDFITAERAEESDKRGCADMEYVLAAVSVATEITCVWLVAESGGTIGGC